MSFIKKFTFNPFQENTYIVYDATNQCVIIDPGCSDQAEREDLIDFIDNMQLKPVYLLNTHCHIDHVLGNRFIAEKYQLKLAANPNDQYNLDRMLEVGLRYGVALQESPAIEMALHHGDEVRFGETVFQVLFTPGHSKGSISFYNKQEHYVIAGDVLFNGSIGRTDLPGGDFYTLIQSIKNKLFVLNDDIKIYSGHGSETSIGHEKKYNTFLK